MNKKSFNSMVSLQERFSKMYGTKGAGLLGVSESYVQIQEEAFAPLCFEVLGTFQLTIKGGTASTVPSQCHYIQLRVVYRGVEFHALASSSEWDAVGFPMTESILYAQADRDQNWIPNSADQSFWSVVLAHLVHMLGEKSPAERGV